MEELKPLNNIEEWREIKDTDGRYFISSLGRVKSIIKSKETILKSELNNKGYYRTKIKIKNVERWKLNHVLVAEAFIERSTNNNEYEIHHIDLNTTNNNKDNLTYLTHEEHVKLHKEIRDGIK